MWEECSGFHVETQTLSSSGDSDCIIGRHAGTDGRGPDERYIVAGH